MQEMPLEVLVGVVEEHRLISANNNTVPYDCETRDLRKFQGQD